jgi:queuine/archaeosine tRNA-ribosyltransferase
MINYIRKINKIRKNKIKNLIKIKPIMNKMNLIISNLTFSLKKMKFLKTEIKNNNMNFKKMMMTLTPKF